MKYLKLLMGSAFVALLLASVPHTAMADEWVICAAENQNCSVPGTRHVRYGADSRWTTQLVTGNVYCGNNVFGDPAPGTRKACYYKQQHRGPQWVKCADEHRYCNFNGVREVRYGSDSRWFYNRVNSSVHCDNNVFGDPAPGIHKACYVKMY